MAVGVLTNVKVDPVGGTLSATYTAASSVGTCSIFCGFKPRVIKMVQMTGTVGAAAMTFFHESMSAGYYVQCSNAGTVTIPTSLGFTLLDGSEAAPATVATGSPASAGPGFTISTGPQVTASAAYLMEAYR
jgi:hypothetical protein